MYTEKEEAVLEILGDKPLTRDEMVRKLKLPRTTIYDVLKKLIE